MEISRKGLLLLASLLGMPCFARRIGSQLIASTDGEHYEGQAANTEAGNVAMIDAGSSGTKVFAFDSRGAEASGKLLSKCSKNNPPLTNKGIAALAYSKTKCAWKIAENTKSPIWKPLAKASPDYVNALLKLLASKIKTKPKNKDSVPMLATAGMRLISQSDNDKVWSFLCGKSGSGLKLAKKGERCGTIPGTTEAYYEFLANAATNISKKLTGTFTVGGASAQIAIPLMKKADLTAFNEMKNAIASQIDCTKLLLSGGSSAPVFSKGGSSRSKTGCIDDYITFKKSSQIKVATAVAAKLKGIQGVGLISFLGLRGRGTFVAGGVNEIQNWAVQENCHTNQSTFTTCASKLVKALKKDVMWKNVAQFFKTHFVNINHFAYATSAAMPQRAFLDDEPEFIGRNEKYPGSKLQQILTKKCGKDNGATFGFKSSNTCMKAYFTSLYVTTFFVNSTVKNSHQLKPPTHVSAEQHFSAGDWANGLKAQEEALLNVSSRRTEEEHIAAEEEQIAALLDVPLMWHSVSYLEGAGLHFAATDPSDPASL